MKTTMNIHPMCKICKYECKVMEFAKIDVCRATKESKEMAEYSKKINKEYDKRRS